MNNKLTFQFNEEQSSIITEMAENLGTTQGEVIKTALALLEVVIHEQKEGHRICTTKNDLIIREIVGIELKGQK